MDAAAELRVLPGRVSIAAVKGLLHCFWRLMSVQSIMI